MVPATGTPFRALDMATARTLCLAVANAGPGTGTILFIF
jgi:hypothetical protein